MIDLPFLWLVGKRVAREARRKGRKPLRYIVFLVLAWYGGAYLGLLFGGAVADLRADVRNSTWYALPCAVPGLEAGAGFTWLWVKKLPVRTEQASAADEGQDDA